MPTPGYCAISNSPINPKTDIDDESSEDSEDYLEDYFYAKKKFTRKSKSGRSTTTSRGRITSRVNSTKSMQKFGIPNYLWKVIQDHSQKPESPFKDPGHLADSLNSFKAAVNGIVKEASTEKEPIINKENVTSLQNFSENIFSDKWDKYMNVENELQEFSRSTSSTWELERRRGFGETKTLIPAVKSSFQYLIILIIACSIFGTYALFRYLR